MTIAPVLRSHPARVLWPVAVPGSTPVRVSFHPLMLTRPAMQSSRTKLIAQNKKAFHDYHIEETLEAGIALTGTEVKSLRQGRVNLRDSYAAFEKGELYLVGAHISPYSQGNIFNHDPLRKRKLLLHKRELKKLMGKSQVAGYTVVPTKIYFLDGKAKLEIALAKGKALHDKRQALARKEAEREIERAFRNRYRK